MQSRPINQHQEIIKVIEALIKDKDRGQKSRLHIFLYCPFSIIPNMRMHIYICYWNNNFYFPKLLISKTREPLLRFFLLRQASKCPTIDKRYCDWKMSVNYKITENKNIRQNQVLCIRGQMTSKTFATNFTYYAHWTPTKITNYNNKIK